MEKTLLFFERSDFFNFKEVKDTDGFTIDSIMDFIKGKSVIEEIDSIDTIIDITSLSGYTTSMQAFSEELLIQFSDDIIFIADVKYEELFKFELRYCFSNFIYWESTDKVEIDKKENIKKNKPSSKKHQKITDFTEVELGDFFEKFGTSLYGHDKFKDDFFDLIKTFRIFNKIGEHKILSLFLLGESGVGKTEVARAIYKSLGGRTKLAKINFGNYSSENSLSSLIGSSRGYIGSEDGEIFIRVRDTDVGILLIDEFEKSNATLFNYFLDVLENGKIISSMAEEIDLDGFIIVFTSNISKEDFVHRISPELRSRFDYKSQFTLLYEEDKEKYVEFRVSNIVRKVNEKYNSQLPNDLYKTFLNQIDVNQYKNMRDLNKEIKRTFVEYNSTISKEKDNLNSLEDKNPLLGQ